MQQLDHTNSQLRQELRKAAFHQESFEDAIELLSERELEVETLCEVVKDLEDELRIEQTRVKVLESELSRQQGRTSSN